MNEIMEVIYLSIILLLILLIYGISLNIINNIAVDQYKFLLTIYGKCGNEYIYLKIVHTPNVTNNVLFSCINISVNSFGNYIINISYYIFIYTK